MSRSALRPSSAVAPSLSLSLALSLALSLSLVLAGCGGGPRHIGDITPEIQDRISGAWTLNADESDDPQQALDAARGGQRQPGRRPGGGVAPGGGTGGRGGMPGGGGAMPPRGGQGGGGRGSPEEMRATLRLVTVPPRHLEVSLSDSLVTVAYTAQDVWVLPFGEKVKRELDDDVTLEAKAEWDDGRLVVRRSVSGGGSVTETYMPSADGHRLTVAVESSLGGPAGVEFRRVYDAEGRG